MGTFKNAKYVFNIGKGRLDEIGRILLPNERQLEEFGIVAYG
jgi:hypothetical protein